jgi:hypothetical protein
LKIKKYKKFLLLGKAWLWGLLFLSPLTSCSKEDEFEFKGQHFNYATLEDDIPDSVRYYVNPKYPVRTDSLRILAIGNSFTEDAMQYMDAMVKASGIDISRICVSTLTEGSSNFETWPNKDYENKVFSLNRVTGTAVMQHEGKLRELLHQNWDVIVVQQSSTLSYDWKSFAYLKGLEEKLLMYCTNPGLCLAFQLVWSHDHSEMPYVLEGNIACCKKMMNRYGIDLIIPTGVAIQNARDTRLNDDMYLTRDYWHLNKGMARYIATATWFESLFKPVFNVTVMDNSCQPDGKNAYDDIVLAKQCVIKAVTDPLPEMIEN